MLFVIVLCNVLNAENDLKGKLAIGYNGSPTIRYWLTEKMGIEGNFSLRWRDNRYPSSTNQSQDYSIGISGIRNIKKTKMVNFNVDLFLSYSYVYVNDTYNYQEKNEDNNYTIGIGPEFEVFIPSLPNLSLSSSILLNYTYSSNKITRSGITTKTTGNDINFNSNGFTLLGLDIRYYFN